MRIVEAMPIFLVHPKAISDRDKVRPRVTAAYPGAFLELQSGSWLLSAAGTSEEVSNKLGVTGADHAPSPSVIVFTISGYFGRAPNDVWEWLKANMQSGARA
jgi:hypothetical protein